jgi:type IV pilus assembly PilM-like protein
VRTVGAGGNTTTAAISAALDLPINDAEAVKRRMAEDSPQMQAAGRAALPSMQDLVSEIKNSVQYFASLPGRLPVGRVLVTGGGTDLDGFVTMLEEQVGLPVLRVSPLSRVDDSKLGLSDDQASEVGPVLASPIGLALPEPDKAVKKFNLIPPEVAHRMRLKRIQERTLVACAAVLILLLGFGLWKLYKVHSTENSVNALQGNITALNAQVPKYDLVVAANNAYSAGLTRRSSVLSTAIDWPLAWNQLVSITPAGAQVTSFNGQTVTGNSSSASSSAASTASTASATTTTASSGATTGSTPTSAAIGSIQLTVNGPGPDLSISEAWINAVAGSNYFANPLQGATVSTGNIISFPFTVSVTPDASLNKNASLK